jgi:hypothetical protein
MRGRKPIGPELVQRLQGAAADKERLEVILQTIAGTLRVQEACRRLGISKQRLGVLRQQALQAALGALAPGVPGRPRPVPSAAQEQRDALAEDNERLRRELAASQLREELALLLPRRPERGEKKSGRGGRR